MFYARSASAGAAALLGGSWLASFGFAETKGPAKTVINRRAYAPISIAGCSVRFWNIWVVRFIPACMNRIRSWPTNMAFAKM